MIEVCFSPSPSIPAVLMFSRMMIPDVVSLSSLLPLIGNRVVMIVQLFIVNSVWDSR